MLYGPSGIFTTPSNQFSAGGGTSYTSTAAVLKAEPLVNPHLGEEHSTSFQMDRAKVRATKTAPHGDVTTGQSPRGHRADHRALCDRREKLGQTKCPRPILHPDVEHAPTEERSVFRFSEDSRPMFSPIPGNSFSDPDSEESPSPRASHSKSPEDRTSFPAIHVERCEKSPPACLPPSPDPASHSPDSDGDVDNEVMSTSQGSTGCLSVPSPFLHRKSDGRIILVTQDSTRGMLTSWSRSEGNLPEAVRRSCSNPGSHSQLLDTKYRPDWYPRPTLRQSSDVALHELRRQGQRSPLTPRRLTARLEPLNLGAGQRTLSANNLNSSPGRMDLSPNTP